MKRDAWYALVALAFIVQGYCAEHAALTALGWLTAGATVQSVASRRACGVPEGAEGASDGAG